MGLIQLIKKMLGFAPPPAKFLTPDGRPKEPEKKVEKPAPKDLVPEIPPKPYLPNKIAYVVTKSNFGGAQRYVYDLATHAPPDADVVVICGKAHGMQDGRLVHKLTEAGVRTLAIPQTQVPEAYSER